MDEMQTFLQDTVIPAMKELIQITKGMADGYSEDHRELTQLQVASQKREQQSQEVSTMLIKSVDTLNNHMTDLVNSMNESNRLAVKQNQLLETIQDTLAENTSRIKALALIQEKQTEDPGTKALYDKLKSV